MPFRDRSNAGKKLANALKGYEGQDPVILALPRGGVPVAAEIAASLRAPLDVILVRKNALQIEAGALAERVAVRCEDDFQIRAAPGDRTRGVRCAVQD